MNRHHHSARALAETIVHANSYRQSHEEARLTPDSPSLTIALSRQVGAGGTSIATEIGNRLGWPVYDHALLERIAAEMHLRTQLLESVDERHMPWLTDSLNSFSQSPSVSSSSYVRHLIQTILSLGAHGSCIIVGRGSPYILPPAATLRVRIIADREHRVVGLSRESGISRAEADAQLDRIDRERLAFIKDHFLKDPRDSQNFDVVLNSSCFSYAECADLIIEALHRLEARIKAGEAPCRV
ncbi:MAG TPA: cytidylate kinase-like family protein [Gemmataceae bacterium]|nr:cytidylate kinase-like family protein [Gemmataceae bacterium]